MDDGRGLDTMGPNISRSLFWFVLVLPLLADAAAAGVSVAERETNWFYRRNTASTEAAEIPPRLSGMKCFFTSFHLYSLEMEHNNKSGMTSDNISPLN